eukprot:CAMPEP_0118976286 /NCGR_PEP_ID=MMETSP1173-20130426/18332_1 /TAXON_ID=1034831 /ORGANISM="Rhizochromulina marina cf, Strain CCMP1243" /LENGTH=99 /DNA_ID=CAMNT_0006926303 /DNA_START=229 /DNA_END=529 /DNA_ORIENTATION=-
MDFETASEHCPPWRRADEAEQALYLPSSAPLAVQAPHHGGSVRYGGRGVAGMELHHSTLQCRSMDARSASLSLSLALLARVVQAGSILGNEEPGEPTAK